MKHGDSVEKFISLDTASEGIDTLIRTIGDQK